jgi:hypothetical protein
MRHFTWIFTRIREATSVFLPSTLSCIKCWCVVLIFPSPYSGVKDLDPCRNFDNDVWCFISWKSRGKYWMSALTYDIFRHSQNHPTMIIRFYVSGRWYKGKGKFSLCNPWKCMRGKNGSMAPIIFNFDTYGSEWSGTRNGRFDPSERSHR